MDRNPPDDYLTSEQNSSLQLLSCELAERARTGYGSATAHHGEIFQGVVEGSNGRLHRSLVTLPCGLFKSEAIFKPDLTGVIKIEPAWRVKALKAVKLALADCNKADWGGTLQIFSNIPVGWGLGSSTGDVIAAIRAVADAFEQNLNCREIASIAVRAEAASDSMMFDRNMILFAHREGVVLEDLGGLLPSLEVLGFNTDPTGAGIDTLSFSPARYSWWEIEAFRPLMGLLRRAIQDQDSSLVGQVATASAHINQQYLPKPHFNKFQAVVEQAGAVGFQVAHSGTIVGILFDPKRENTESRIQHAQRMVSEMGFEQTWRFSIRTEESNSADSVRK